MSARLFSMALDTDTPPREKLIIAKMVDMCDDDGKRIYLAVATLARAGSCSERHVQRTLRQFCAIGLLRVVREGGGGRGSATRYEMDVSLLERLRQLGMYEALVADSLNAPPANDDGSSHAADACDETAEESDSAQTKGDTQSPLDPLRVTGETLRVTAGVTQPLIDPLTSEREGAQALARTPTSNVPATDAPDAERVTLDVFRKRWPTTLADDKVKVENAWAALAFEDRRAALAGINAFLAGLKGIGRTKLPAGSNYLSQRKWLDVAALVAERQGGSMAAVAGWSREWWYCLLDRVLAGRPGSFVVMQAEAGKTMTVPQRDLDAIHARIGELKPFVCTGQELEAWRPWLAQRGARIPVFDGQFRVFLPGPVPPGESADDGDDDVRL